MEIKFNKDKLELENIKKEFPLINQTEKPLVYLDTAASSQKPKIVLDKLNEAYTKYYSNIHSGVHDLSVQSTNGIEEARVKVGKFINAKDANTVVFTSGATESINFISYGLRHRVSEGDNVVISIAEHHANLIPWQRLCEFSGAELRFVRVDGDGKFDYKHFEELVDKQTKIIAISHVSNVLGTAFPVFEICRKAKEVGAVSVIDGCQGAVHYKVDVQKLDCDFYVASSHKLYGPSGVGFMYGKPDLLDEMEPMKLGGGAIAEVSTEGHTFKPYPVKFEAGTPPIAETIAFGTAVEYLTTIGMDIIVKHDRALLEYLCKRLGELPYIKFIGKGDSKGSLQSFYIKEINSIDLATLMNTFGVCVRAGQHCAQPLHTYLDIPPTIRASVGIHNTKEDVDKFIDALKKSVKILKNV